MRLTQTITAGLHVGAYVGIGLALCGSAAQAAESTEPVFYHIFLTDGSTVVSYGEYSRVGDQVIFSMPLGADQADPRLHLVSIPSATVDWTTTERYAESARYAHYAETRGESDFVLMSSEVARALNEIALTEDRQAQLRIAEQARNTLMAWPRRHYGYRANDVRQVVSLLDEAISEIRIAAGEQRFDLSFVAVAESPPSMPLMPRPTLQETIAQVLGAARVTTVPAERMSLLHAAMGLLDEGAASLPGQWVDSTRALASGALASELKVERAYAELSSSMLDRAESHAAAANVRGVEGLVRKIRQEDMDLGARRPNLVSALRAAVDGRLTAARQLRLERDRWALRIKGYRSYQRALSGPYARFVKSKPMLVDIRALAGPDPDAFTRLDRQLDDAAGTLDLTTPPIDLQAVHDLLIRAVQLAQAAVDVRREAVASGNLRTAWDASSVASGSLMLFARAQAELERHLKIPEFR